MRKLIIFLLVVLGGYLVYKFVFKKKEAPREEPKPLVVSKHSDVFNQSVHNILTKYFAMTDGFVHWDAEAVNKNATALQQSLSELKVDELKKDSTIFQTVIFPLDNAKSNVTTILSAPAWPEKRRALQDLSDNLRMLLITVKYDAAVTYWQECPMAFGEGQSANWLSSKEEVLNPYLGDKDPKYGNTMLNCGETKATIDFTRADSSTVQ